MNTSFTQRLSYLWSCLLLVGLTGALSAQTFEVTAPAGIAGTYNSESAVFGPQFDDFSGEVAIATDTSGATTGCFMIDNNVTDVTGKVALIDRGVCGFTTKVLNAQDAGAIAVIVCNNDTDNPDMAIPMGGNDDCLSTTPAVMLSFNDCQTIKAETGVTVSYTAPGLPGPGENFVTAIDITDGTYTVDSITGAGGLFSGSTGGAFYRYVAADNGVLNINSCGGGTDTRLLLGAGACAGAFTLIDFSIDDCDDGDGNIVASDLDVLVEAGQEYYILWDDAQSADGFDFTVTLNDLPLVDLTLTVNMEQETVDPDGVSIVWAFADVTDLGDVSVTSMTDNGDGTWSGTIEVTTLDTIGYAFMNGPLAVDNVEDVPDGFPCSVDGGFGFNVRPHIVTNIDSAGLAPVCFSECANCQLIDVTFQVDMANETVDPGGVFMSWASTSGDSGIEPMADDNMDGVYDVTLEELGTATNDTIIYTFFNGATAEMVPGACSITDGNGNNVRAIILGGTDDAILAPVCFSECGNCPALDCQDAPVVDENIDGYTTGDPIGPQSAIWTTWSGDEGGVEDLTVSDEQAFSAPNSVKVEGNLGPADGLLLLGNQSEGVWMVRFKLYVEPGFLAYYNIQEDEVPAVAWNIEVQFNGDGTGNIVQAGTPVSDFNYTEGEWIDVVHYIDLDNDFLELRIGDQGIWEQDYPGNIGALNLFPADGDHLYYIDDAQLIPLNDCPVDAIICENFETYNLSTISNQSVHFNTWDNAPGSATDAIVTDQVVSEGCNALEVSEAGGDDIVLLLGDLTEGNYILEWKEYIPSGFSGYYNFQKVEGSPGQEFGGQVFLNEDGTGSLDAGGGAAATFTYPQDEWFQVRHFIDLDNDIITMEVAGQEVFTWPANWQAFETSGLKQLGGINFFGNTGNLYYIDELYLIAQPSVPGNACAGSIDINNLFGQGLDNPQLSDTYDNNNYSTLPTDPTEGYECFGEPDGSGSNPTLNNTMWFTFTGDGENYDIITVDCGTNDPIEGGDTQFALYSGDDCGDLTPVNCNDDLDINNDIFEAGFEDITLEDGVVYQLMVDGFEFQGSLSDGEYCIEVNQLTETIQEVEVTVTVDMTLFVAQGNTVDPAGIHIAGTFNGFDPEPTTDNGDGTWSHTFTVVANTEVLYKFVNGPEFGSVNGLDQEGTANISDCGVDDGFGGFNRVANIGDADEDLGTFCWDYCVICDEVVSINEVAFQNGLKLFPNPASDEATIQFNFNETLDLNVRVFNNLGQVVIESEVKEMQAGTTQLDLSNLPSGMYMVQITDGENNYTEKLTVKK